jgi:hypothetical protein
VRRNCVLPTPLLRISYGRAVFGSGDPVSYLSPVVSVTYPVRGPPPRAASSVSSSKLMDRHSGRDVSCTCWCNASVKASTNFTVADGGICAFFAMSLCSLASNSAVVIPALSRDGIRCENCAVENSGNTEAISVMIRHN